MMYVGVMGGGWQVFDKDENLVASDKGIYPLDAHLKNFFDCMRTRKQPNGNIVEGHKSAASDSYGKPVVSFRQKAAYIFP